MNPRGKTALVTGASSGIGAATAHELAKAGARVILVARREEQLRRVAASIGNAASVYPTDLSDEKAVTALGERVTSEIGTPDIIVNNAGAGRWKFVEETTPQEAVQLMAVPYFAAFYVTHAFLPGMLRRNSGHIVNVSSVGSRFVWPGATAYLAAGGQSEASLRPCGPTSPRPAFGSPCTNQAWFGRSTGNTIQEVESGCPRWATWYRH